MKAAKRGMDRPPKRLFEFDSFRIDPEERLLLRDGEPVYVTPKVFELMVLLIENRGHALGKEELMERLWAGTFTEENNLSRNISMLRKALGDDVHRPRYIKTIPKLGYRFEPDVREVLENENFLVVENRTNYTIAVREEIEHTGRSVTRLSGALRFLIRRWAVITVFAILVVAAALFATASLSGVGSSSRNLAVPGGTSSVEAEELYQKGRKLWEDRSASGLHEAIMLLEKAVEIDPKFARGHAALADAYAFDSTRWKLAETTAQRAIEIEPGLGQPYATIGFVQLFWDWKPVEAERNFRTAIALSPDYATAHQWYALELASGGQLNEGLSEMKTALELDPAAAAINVDMCRMQYFLQRYDEAEKQCRKCLEADPRSYTAHRLLYEIYTARGMYREAVESFITSERLTVNSSTLPADLIEVKAAFEQGGIRAFWQKLINIRQVPVEEKEYVAVRYYALLGDREAALRGLKRVYAKRDFGMILLSADPVFREYYSDNELNSMLSSFEN